MRFRKRGNEPSVRVRRLEAAGPQAAPWRLPWPVMSVVAAFVTAAASWLLVTGFCVLGWITVPAIKASAVLQLGTQGWLLAHGVSVALPGAQVSVAPLGLTLIVIAVGLGACHQAVTHSHPPQAGILGVRTVRMGLVFGLVYLVVIGIARNWTEGQRLAQPSLLGAIVLVFGLGLVGSARALGWGPARLPWWTRAAGSAVLAGLGVMVASGAAVVVTALVSGRDRVAMVHDALEPGVLGGVMLLAAQLAWLPNFVLWGGAWAVGAGVQLGLQTVISPAQSFVGMLPAIPVLGAVPPAGPMPKAALLWLASGVAAGAVAAWLFVRQAQRWGQLRGRPLGVDVTAIAGALVGVACGLAFTLMQVPASGDLGSVRLVDLGARLGAVTIMAPTSMGLAGMMTGAVLGWRSRPKPADAEAGHKVAEPSTQDSEVLDEADLPTSVVAGRKTDPTAGG